MFELINAVLSNQFVSDYLNMTKQRGKIGKYSKISLQKKYELLRLCQFNDNNLRETSKNLQINYSTAKTILFQFQNYKIRSPLNFLDKRLNEHKIYRKNKPPHLIANYKPYTISDHTKRKFKIECTLNGEKSPTSTDMQDSVKGESSEVKSLGQERQKSNKSSDQKIKPNSDEQTQNQMNYQISIQNKKNTAANSTQEVYGNCNKIIPLISFYDFFQDNHHENGSIKSYLIEGQYSFGFNVPTWIEFFFQF